MATLSGLRRVMMSALRKCSRPREPLQEHSQLGPNGRGTLCLTALVNTEDTMRETPPSVPMVSSSPLQLLDSLVRERTPGLSLWWTSPGHCMIRWDSVSIHEYNDHWLRWRCQLVWRLETMCSAWDGTVNRLLRSSTVVLTSRLSTNIAARHRNTSRNLYFSKYKNCKSGHCIRVLMWLCIEASCCFILQILIIVDWMQARWIRGSGGSMEGGEWDEWTVARNTPSNQHHSSNQDKCENIYKVRKSTFVDIY